MPASQSSFVNNSSPIGPRFRAGATSSFQADDTQITQQQVFNINKNNFFGFFRPLKGLRAQMEATLNSPTNDYVDPRSNDRFSRNYVSLTPENIKVSSQSNITTMVDLASSEKINAIVFPDVNGWHADDLAMA